MSIRSYGRLATVPANVKEISNKNNGGSLLIQGSFVEEKIINEKHCTFIGLITDDTIYSVKAGFVGNHLLPLLPIMDYPFTLNLIKKEGKLRIG